MDDGRAVLAGPDLADAAEARLRFLIDAGTQLDSSLDLMVTLRTLARIVVTHLGDLCMVDVLWTADRAERVVLAHVDPDVQQEVEAALGPWPSVFDVADDGIRDTIRAGRTVLRPDLSPADVRAAFTDPALADGAVSWQFRSAIIVPLVAHGRVLGAITVCLTGPGGPAYTPQHVALVEDLARRASLAVDNSRLYTELRRADEFERFLAEASRVLADSLDWDTTLATTARHVVAGGVADLCLIHVLDRRDRAQVMALEHVDPDKRELCLKVDRLRFPLRPGSYLMQALSSGSSVLRERVTEADWVLWAAGNDAMLAQLRLIDISSILFAPMASPAGMLGTICLAVTESDRRLGAADLALAEELGRRAGVAAENARLYSDRSRVAQTLQGSLLPARLAAVPHLDVAARFRPAGDGTEVGGDFYDLFEHHPGRWTAVVGDVCGKGAAAAAVTALARHTVRVVARHEDGPAGVLRALHRAVAEQSPANVFCTAALADCVPGPGTCRVRLALGGHPPAVVLRADGRVETLEPAGPVLGVLDRVDIGEVAVTLAAGDALLLYTDGVTEAGAPDTPLGEDWLSDTLRGLIGRDPDAIADEITRKVLRVEGDHPRDDIAVLVLRVTP